MAEQIDGSRHWVLASEYIPSCDEITCDFGGGWCEYKSPTVLCWTRWGSFSLAYATEVQDEGESTFGWKEDGSEGWDLTGDIVWWQSLPDAPEGD